MIISKLLQSGIVKLNNHKIPTPHLDADVLLSYVLDKPKEYLLTHDNEKVSLKNLILFKILIHRRTFGTPLAYLIKRKAFYGYDFKVNSSVLIPRPETEMIVDDIMATANENASSVLADIGTGSGCIIISTLKELLKNSKKIENFEFFGIDLSKNALNVAKFNAKLLGAVAIKFLQGNLLEPLLETNTTGKNLIITANLPYLTPEQVKNSPSIKKEPKMALLAGSDGLKYYKELFEQVRLLKSKSIIMYCEIDDSQSQDISILIKTALPDFYFEIKKDLQGLNRLVVLTQKQSFS